MKREKFPHAILVVGNEIDRVDRDGGEDQGKETVSQDCLRLSGAEGPGLKAEFTAGVRGKPVRIALQLPAGAWKAGWIDVFEPEQDLLRGCSAPGPKRPERPQGEAPEAQLFRRQEVAHGGEDLLREGPPALEAPHDPVG